MPPLWALLLFLSALGIASSTTEAEACGSVVELSAPRADVANSAGANALPSGASFAGESENYPQIVKSGFVTASRDVRRENAGPTHLWLEFRNTPANARGVILESVWGNGPDALSQMWSKVHPVFDDVVMAYPNSAGRHRDQPFSLGVRARFVFADGSLSVPSLPVFIHHAGAAKHQSGVHADQVLMVLCCLSLLGLWMAFRKDDDPIYKIRIAAMAALVSLFFLSVAPALSWQVVSDSTGIVPAVDCHLGDEAQCATYVPDAGPNPMSVSEVAAQRRFELASWMGASSALRVGLVWCLILLLPALIWLLVVPTLRPAQTAVAFGASAAGYTFLAALFYRLCTPSWMDVEVTRAFDLTLLTSGTIFFAIGLIIRWSLRLDVPNRSVPAAVARRL